MLGILYWRVQDFYYFQKNIATFVLLVVQHSSWLFIVLSTAPVGDNRFFFLCIFSSLLHPTFLFLRTKLVKGIEKQIQTKFATIFWKYLHFDRRHQVATAHAYWKGFSIDRSSVKRENFYFCVSRCILFNSKEICSDRSSALKQDRYKLPNCTMNRPTSER